MSLDVAKGLGYHPQGLGTPPREEDLGLRII